MRQRPRAIGLLALFTNVALVVIGNLTSNLVSATLPPIVRQGSLPILVTIALAELVVAILLARLQNTPDEPTRERSKARRRARVCVLIVSELLAAAGGVASNVAADGLPVSLRSYALLLFIGVTALAVAISLFVEHIASAPKIRITSLKSFLKNLQDQYSRQLEDALRGAPLLAPHLRMEPEATEADALMPDRQIPMEATISDVFDMSAEHLLILGEPGSGKTTLLVELGTHLLRRALDDEQYPIPVVFDLATWAINRSTFAEWMIEELIDRYQVSPDLARTWVGNDKVIPLADGLDELDGSESVGKTKNAREACVHELNNFLETHAHLPIVICCRNKEYRRLQTRLQLGAAIVIEPLTDEQIGGYLENGGEHLRPLRAFIANDPDLRTLLRVPLFLHLVRLAAQYLPTKIMHATANQDALRQQLLQDYVSVMLERERNLEQHSRYTPEEATHYLIWLAQQMKQRRLVEFNSYQMDWKWLPPGRSRTAYHLFRWVGLAPVGLIGGVVSGAILGFAARFLARGLLWSGPLAIWLAWGLIGGLAIGLVSSLLGEFDSIDYGHGLGTGLVSGIVGGLAGVIFSRTDGLDFASALEAAVIAGLCIGMGAWIMMFMSFIGDTDPGTIGDLVLWLLGGPVSAMLGGMSGGLAGGLAKSLYVWSVGLPSVIWSVVPITLFGSVIFSLILVIRAENNWKDLGWWLLYSVLGGAQFGLLIGLLVPHFSPIRISEQQGQIDSVLIGIVVTMVIVCSVLWGYKVLGERIAVGLLIGVCERIENATLRIALRWVGLIPPDYDSFLQYAADHALLLESARGFRFLHALLLDYFAAQTKFEGGAERA